MKWITIFILCLVGCTVPQLSNHEPQYYFSYEQYSATKQVKFIRVGTKYYPWTDYEYIDRKRYLQKAKRKYILVGSGPVYKSTDIPDQDQIVWPVNLSLSR